MATYSPEVLVTLSYSTVPLGNHRLLQVYRMFHRYSEFSWSF